MILTVLLVGMAVMLLVGFVLRRMGGKAPQPAYSGPARTPAPGTYGNVGYETTPAPLQRVATVGAGGARPGSAMDQFMRGNGATAPWGIPAGFDTKAFLAAAKDNYARLQQAWDSGNLDDLAEFTTNQMFVTLTHDLHDRDGKTRTEVVALDAELLGIESTADEHIASVKFDGSLKVDGEIERVSEVWNLAKPVRGGGWVLAGIQQLA
jgi:predicted lipid-binding transport protein (Tim44 family)